MTMALGLLHRTLACRGRREKRERKKRGKWERDGNVIGKAGVVM